MNLVIYIDIYMWFEVKDNLPWSWKQKDPISQELWEVLSGPLEEVKLGNFDNVAKLTSLDKEAAESLRDNFKWINLDLSNVTEISLEVAKVLKDISVYVFDIWLDISNSIEVLKEILWSKSDALNFVWITSIGIDFASVIPTSNCLSLGFRQITELPDNKINWHLANFKGQFEFHNIERITLKLIESFEWYTWTLRFDSYKFANVDSVSVLYRIKELWLKVYLAKRYVDTEL